MKKSEQVERIREKKLLKAGKRRRRRKGVIGVQRRRAGRDLCVRMSND